MVLYKYHQEFFCISFTNKWQSYAHYEQHLYIHLLNDNDLKLYRYYQ